MLSDIVGTSVLTFTGVSVHLGYLLSTVLIVGLFPLAFFISVCMTRTRQTLLETAALERPGCPAPRVETMGEIAGLSLRNKKANSVVTFAVYGYTLLGQSSYLLVLGTAFQRIFFSTSLCLTVTVGISCACLAIPAFALRRLGDSIWICAVNTLLIGAVVIIALAKIAMEESPPCDRTFLVAPSLTFMTAMGQATNVVYAYSGQWMYFELMDSMEEPNLFPQAFAIAGPLMMSMYLAVAILGYGLGAGDGDLIAGMAPGLALRMTAVLLFLHVVVVYLIKGVVLARYFHRLCSPSDAEARTAASYLKHGGCGVGMLCFGYIVANAVPFFSQLLGIIGGLLAGPINFLFPAVFYLTALGRRHAAAEETERLGTAREAIESSPKPKGASLAPISKRELGKSPEVDSQWSHGSIDDRRSSQSSGACAEAEDEAYICEDKGGSAFMHARLGLSTLPFWEVATLTGISAFILLTMVVGVTFQIQEVISLNRSVGPPFSCHALTVAGAPTCQ